MRGQRNGKSEESAQERETKAGRMVRLIGMLPDALLEEALSEKTAQEEQKERTAEAEKTGHAAECGGAVRGSKRRFPAAYWFAAAACLALFFAGVWQGRFLQLPGQTARPESGAGGQENGEAGADGQVAEAEGIADGEVAEEIADSREENTKPEEGPSFEGGFFYGGQLYRDAGTEVREVLPDGWSLLGYLTVTGTGTPAELDTGMVSPAGCPAYGKTETAEGDGSLLAAAGIYVLEKDGYRLYLPRENDKQQKGEKE